MRRTTHSRLMERRGSSSTTRRASWMAGRVKSVRVFACVDAQRWVLTRSADFLSSLPHEISLYILLHLDFPSLLTSTAVSQQWRTLASDNLVWRDLFHREKRWRIREDIGDVAEAYGVGAAGLGSAPPLKKTGSASVSGGATPRRSVAADGGVSGSRLGRHLSDMMADLSGLSLTPMRERRRTAASQALPSPVISDDAEPSWTSTSTATPRRPASGIVNNPFPPLSSSGTLPPLSLPTLSTSNPDDGFFLSRNPSSSGLTSLDSSLAIPGGPSRRPSSAALPPLGPVPSPSLGITPSAPLFLDWPKLYKDRYVLEQRWAKGTPKTQWLRGHTDSVYCVQFDEFKVVSGSVCSFALVRVGGVADDDLCAARSVDSHLGCSHWTLRQDAPRSLGIGSLPPVRRRDPRLGIVGCEDPRLGLGRRAGDGQGAMGDQDVFGRAQHGRPRSLLRRPVDRQLLKGASSSRASPPCERLLTSETQDTTIRVWHKATGELYRTLSGHGGPVNAIQLLANRIISAAGDALMKMWDVETGEVMRVFTGHERGLACLQYSPSGKLIATGSNDRLVKIWDAETGECLRTLEGHTDLVRSLAFDETRGRLVTGSYDRSVRLWDLDTGESLLRFKAHASLVFDVSLSASKIVRCVLRLLWTCASSSH